MKSRNGLKKRRKFHYLLGLTKEQIEENTTSLFKWLDDNENQYQEGIRNYASQLKEKNKTRR